MTWPAIATFNTGSSSLKFSVYAIDGDGLGKPLLRGAIEDMPHKPRLVLDTNDRSLKSRASRALAGVEPTPAHQIEALAAFMDSAFDDVRIAAVGHRIVHGGTACDGPRLATDKLLDELDKLAVFAPSHQPHNLAGVRAISNIWPDRPQTLSFDTAFHRTQPEIAQLYALPDKLTQSGIRRYGFHGLSYKHLANEAPHLFEGRASRKLIAAHLGSGASLCGMQSGASVATTMGLTALDGLPMSTRCGDLDPGVLLHLLMDRDMSAEEVSDLLYRKSGLLGVSGLSGDVRDLLARKTKSARRAIDLFVYRIAREVGSLAAALGGLDAIVFTGGVGENAAEIRRRVCHKLNWLGVELDGPANVAGYTLISTVRSDVAVGIIRANEERVIAEEGFDVLVQTDCLALPS